VWFILKRKRKKGFDHLKIKSPEGSGASGWGIPRKMPQRRGDYNPGLPQTPVKKDTVEKCKKPETLEGWWKGELKKESSDVEKTCKKTKLMVRDNKSPRRLTE